MAASTLSRRRGSAHAKARAAKERKQKVMLIVGVALLLLLLVWEIPKVLKSSGGGSSPSASAPPAAAVPATATPAAPSAPSAAVVRRDRLAIKRLAPHDPFGQTSASGATPTYGQVGPPAGYRDPFDAKVSSSSVPAPPATPTSTSTSSSTPLPAKIVIGTPGAGRVAKQGWIVILASIPTKEGHASAQSFASTATKRGLSVSILNSSNTRPLRGGYWVVYTGPFSTIAQVTSRAASVHQLGYTGAYVRELIQYRTR
jgi:hypothetical protein